MEYLVGKTILKNNKYERMTIAKLRGIFNEPDIIGELKPET